MTPTDELPKVCVILGAGASKDVHNGSAPILLQGNYRPPLARDLFAISTHPEYFAVLQRYPGAQSLAAVLSPPSDSSGFDLESRLRELAEHPDERVRQQFKQVPPYLRDLLWFASYQYTPTPGTYLQLVYALLADSPHHVLFLVLNYDTLLEQALAQFDGTFIYDSITAYVREDRQSKVVKLHGSINWFKLMGGSGLDQDLLALLDDAVAPSLRPAIQLVGVSDGEDALQRFESGVRAFRGQRRRPPGFLFTNGFRRYVDSGEMAAFAEFQPR